MMGQSITRRNITNTVVTRHGSAVENLSSLRSRVTLVLLIPGDLQSEVPDSLAAVFSTCFCVRQSLYFVPLYMVNRARNSLVKMNQISREQASFKCLQILTKSLIQLVRLNCVTLVQHEARDLEDTISTLL